MTDFFAPWCDPQEDETVGKHTASVLTSNDDTRGVEEVVKIMPRTYARKKNLARIAERHHKNGVAKLLSRKVPMKQPLRSGDMGEILGTAYLKHKLGYTTGPSRLIERDTQDWPMRGDDILGARLTERGVLELTKVEAKSRAKAGEAAIIEARKGLLRNGDLASPHSLTQFAERLLKKHDTLSDAVNDMLQNDGLRPRNITHVMFIPAGNHPISHVRADLNSYKGSVVQRTVTVHLAAHQEFIRTSYEAVLADAT